MPQAEIKIYQEPNGEAPLIKWLQERRKKARDKCQAYIEHLREVGYDARRPIADHLRDKIYELRPDFQGIHYRILYTFVGQNIVLLTNGTIKEKEVPAQDIDRAIEYRKRYEANPQLHTYTI